MAESTTGFLNLITWSALELLRQILAESARSGKSVEELLDSAQAQTGINREIAASLLAKLKSE